MAQRFMRNDDAAARAGAILAAVAVVQLLVSLDLSIVNVALPDIADGLKFSASGLAWVIHAYALTFGGLLLLGGKSADVFGRRRMLVIGLAVFAGASLGRHTRSTYRRSWPAGDRSGSYATRLLSRTRGVVSRWTSSRACFWYLECGQRARGRTGCRPGRFGHRVCGLAMGHVS